MKRQNISIFQLLIVGLFLVVASSCEKDDDNNSTSDDTTNGKTTAIFNPDVTYGTMTDQEGNIYKTVTIGKQTWMAENLRTTIYYDGTAIPNITDDDEWGNSTTGAYSNYNNNTSVDTIATYGRLYNWYAVNTGKLAPTGWHVPTDAEWTTLTDYLGGTSEVGGKLKEIGTTHWISPNANATNETGFTALPGGYRYSSGAFSDIGSYGDWWSASESYTSDVWYRRMYYYSSDVLKDYYNKELGYSIRCVRD
nr:fibrobacter succinogenes major paralogous domain-containing protein [uncultured Carboxylicivirga sp.]